MAISSRSRFSDTERAPRLPANAIIQLLLHARRQRAHAEPQPFHAAAIAVMPSSRRRLARSALVAVRGTGSA